MKLKDECGMNVCG